MCIPEVCKPLMPAKKLINIEIIASSYHMLNVTDYIQGVKSSFFMSLERKEQVHLRIRIKNKVT